VSREDGQATPKTNDPSKCSNSTGRLGEAQAQAQAHNIERDATRDSCVDRQPSSVLLTLCRIEEGLTGEEGQSAPGHLSQEESLETPSAYILRGAWRAM
jgi:hypothetical protein